MSLTPWDYWQFFATSAVGEPAGEPDRDRAPPIVTVFGAGITGLSAAHELVERGFAVQVVEKDESLLDEYECRVGGMAANQLSRVAASIETLHPNLSDGDPDLQNLRTLRARRLQPTQHRFPIKQRIRFSKLPGTDWRYLKDEHGTSNQTKLTDVLELLHKAYETYEADYQEAADYAASNYQWSALSLDVKCREILLVEIRGFTDTDDMAQTNRNVSRSWADTVRQELLALNSSGPAPIPHLDKHLTIAGLGATAPLGDQRSAHDRARSNRVEFSVVEQVIPGEHGFRFFPSFYRHLFDTMRRTPVLDERGNETAETTYDQLVPTPDANIALEDENPPFDLDTRRIRSLKDVEAILDILLRKVGFTDRDVLRLQVAMLKFMTSCRERREKESEDINFWNYVGGDTAGYSDGAKKFILGAPKALAAMSAVETDARTQLSILVQMLVKSPFSDPIDDMTLNNSSSEAWLRVWKGFLRRKGVLFFVGTLDGLEFVDDSDGKRFLAKVSGPGDWKHPRPEDARDSFVAPKDCDFFLIALPFEAASDLVWKASKDTVDKGKLSADAFDGPFAQLMRFDVDAQRRSQLSGDTLPRTRDPVTGRPSRTRDPLRDISGIQYFFPNFYRFGRGHVYFFDSKWALTSISQLAYWRDRTDPIGNFLGQNSVDIGDWYEPDGQSKKTAWRSGRQEIAEVTWNQIKNALDKRLKDTIISPLYYHLDRGIEFETETFVGYLGNAMLRVDNAVAGTTYRLDLYNSAYGITETIEMTGPWPDTTNLAARLVRRLNAIRRGRFIFAVATESNQIVVSPFTRGGRRHRGVVIAVRGASSSEFKVKVGRAEFGSLAGPPESVFNHLLTEMADAGLTVHPLPGSFNFVISTREPVAVVNADDMIEIVDGPQLVVGIENRDVQLLRRPQRSSSRTTQVIVPDEVRISVPAPEAGRTYRVRLALPGTGLADVAVTYPVPARDTLPNDAEELRDGLINQLDEARTRAPWYEVSIPSVAPGEAPQIAVRPVADVESRCMEVEVKDLDMTSAISWLALGNSTPFLINVPGQWQYRSGLSRATQATLSSTTAVGRRAEFRYWHKSEALERWFLAGTFMATHTRMTTMEAANESARHAVNAVLDKILQMDQRLNKAYAGKLIADPCDIWDLEENELDDFDYFKRLDEALCEAGLPHFFDILRLADVVEGIPRTTTGRLRLWDEIREFVEELQIDALGQFAADGAVGRDAFENLIKELRTVFDPKAKK